MEININLDNDFEKQIDKLKKKYGDEWIEYREEELKKSPEYRRIFLFSRKITACG